MSNTRLLPLSATILWLLLGINAGCGGADDTSTSTAEGVGGTQATGGTGGEQNVGGNDDNGGAGGGELIVYAIMGEDGQYHCPPPMEVGPEKDRPPRCQTSASIETPDATPHAPDSTPDEPDAALPPPDAATACRDYTNQVCDRGEDRGGECLLTPAPPQPDYPCLWNCGRMPTGTPVQDRDISEEFIPATCHNMDH